MSGAASAAGAKTRQLAVSITGGESAFAQATSHTFATTASASVSGGSGSYSYAWAASDYADTWTFIGQGAPSVTVQVSGVFPGEPDSANVTCTVTDTVTGKTALSNSAFYTFYNTT